VQVHHAIKSGDSGALLSSVLKRMKTENRERCRPGRMHAHHAAFVVEF
jgi:hypothetical protein